MTLFPRGFRAILAGPCRFSDHLPAALSQQRQPTNRPLLLPHAMVIGAAMLLAGQTATVTGASTSTSTAAAQPAIVNSSLTGLGGIPKSPSFHSSLELAAAAKDLKAAATTHQQQSHTVYCEPPPSPSPNYYKFAMPSSSSSSADAKVRYRQNYSLCCGAVRVNVVYTNMGCVCCSSPMASYCTTCYSSLTRTIRFWWA